MNTLKIIIIPLILFTIVSCVSHEKEFDMGKIEENVYTNSFFDTKIHIPIGWSIQSKESIKTLSEVGDEIVSGENEEIKKAVKASEINSATLLTFFRHPVSVGNKKNYNHNFNLIVDNITTETDVTSPKVYLELSRDLLKKSQLKYENTEEEIKKTTIGGKTFSTMELNFKYAGFDIHQKYFSTFINDFCFTILISFEGDNQKEELEKIVNAIEFL